MASADSKTRLYEELADYEHEHGSPQARDRFLILAADAALAAGHNDEAERFRRRILEYNPHHLLRPFPSLADALKSSEVYGYVTDLRSSYPPEEAEQLLASLRRGDGEPGRAEAEPAVFDAAPTAPTTLPDPPPLQTFRFADQAARSGAGESGEPAAAFAGLRETAPAPAPPPPPRRTVHREPVSPTVDEPPDIDGDAERPVGMGTWFSDALFVFVLVVGVAWAGYTLARPFLSLSDSPLK
jgi:hypothetical protein